MSAFPSTPRLLWMQTVYQLRSFRRIPIAVFFTLGLPLIMLVLFNALFGSNRVDTPTGSWSTAQFYTGGLAAFTAVSATFTNLANMVPLRRDEGVLKRWRGTPLPTWVYLGGFICSAVLIAVVGAVAMLALGVVVYDLDVEAAKVPAAIATFLIGVSAFAALGMALAAVVKSASSASAAANAIILPLAFVSSVFVELDDAPRWLEIVGDVFPLKPFVRVLPGVLQSDDLRAGLRLGEDGLRGAVGARRTGGGDQAVPLGTEWFGASRSSGAPDGHRLTPHSPKNARNRSRGERIAAFFGTGDERQRVQENTTVLRPCTSTRCSTWARTARANTIVSRSRPCAVRRFTSSRWVTWAVSCSMIGPSSRSAVA